MDKHRIALADGHEFTLHSDCRPSARVFLYWLPALGVPGRKYQRLADTLADAGIALFAHEWRGTDSSNWRASRRRDWRYRHLFEDIDAGLAFTRGLAGDRPVWIAGHSLGSQLALLQLARDPSLAGALLVAGGSPFWRTFPARKWPSLMLAMFGFPALARVVGHYPGQRVGFAGRESIGVMSDWARSAISGRYRPRGVPIDFETKLSNETRPILSIHLQHDEYVPKPSLQFLLDKAAKAQHARTDLTTADFESGKATHFSWMREPGPVVSQVQGMLAQTGQSALLP
ncbi:MAG: alpha/beta fold hydrolase [Ahniella sp.]|nr:alpha/beta fold hydrolase [Ahniella sp.]